MEPSPLMQQTRPESFQPKVVRLYESLFSGDEHWERPEGFWQELFLLRPDAAGLRRLLAALSPDSLLQLQSETRQLFYNCVERIRDANEPSDGFALDTLIVFLGGIVGKKYAHPSSDIIAVIAGVDRVDTVLWDLVAALEGTIRSGRTGHLRHQAIKAALSITSGTYHTGLVSYLTQRDLFPSLMKFVHESQSSRQCLDPFILLGLLANYNKFELQNPYRLRLDDFVNESTIRRLVQCLGITCLLMRDQYIAAQEDLPEGWTISSTLKYLGLGSLSPRPGPFPLGTNVDGAKSLFSSLPGPEAAVLLSTFDFANANKLFCFTLITLPAESQQTPSPFSSFLSLTSYISQHAHHSDRVSLYAQLNLMILHILVEDQVLIKQLASDDNKANVLLCRYKQPHLPVTKDRRVLACVIMDVIVDGMNHNLRRKLDVGFYLLCVGVILRIISSLSKLRTRLAYHWSELWRSLLSLMRFLTTYSVDIRLLHGHSKLIDLLVNVIALSVSTGESFLPDTASYDDLFYKLVEIGSVLAKFRDAYGLASDTRSSSIDTLVSVSNHYHVLLGNDGKAKEKNTHLSPKEVSRVIKQGYETLSIQARGGLDQWDGFREADHKGLLKRIARAAVEDARALLDEA